MKRILKMAGKFRTLVITDRYLPDSVGGAELSLHISLKEQEDLKDVLVVSIASALDKPSFYTVDNVRVLALPGGARWPFHRLTLHRKAKIEASSEPLRTIGYAWALIAYVLFGPITGMIERLLSLYLYFGRKPSGGAVADHRAVVGAPHIKMLRKLIEGGKPSLIHADNYNSIIGAVTAAKIRSVKLVGLVRDNRFFCVKPSQDVRIGNRPCESCHIECTPARTWDQRLHRSMMQRAQAFRHASLRSLDRVIVTSAFLETQVKSICNGALVSRLPNPADTQSFIDEAVTGVAERVGFNVVVVGMLNENKGQLEFVKHLPALRERIPSVHVHFAGRGERIQKRMIEVAQSLGVSDTISFHGYLDRKSLYVLLRECQVVASPTAWPEPFGRVPLEAGGVCRPIVTFAVGGLKESIEHGTTGMLIEPGDFDGLVAALAELAENPRRRYDMGVAAQRKIQGLFDAGIQARALEQLWKATVRQ